MVQNDKHYLGTRSTGEAETLQNTNSEVQLTIPAGRHSVIFGHIYTDIRHFQNIIPTSECLIAPIPDFMYLMEKETNSDISPTKRFIIRIPHCIKNRDKLKNIKVRQGDIHERKDFKEIMNKPKNSTINPACKQPYYEVDEHFWVTTNIYLGPTHSNPRPKICNSSQS